MSKAVEENRALWEKFIEGDKASFSAFYKKNYPLLFNYGLSLRMEEEQTGDIIQEIFLKLYSNPKIIKDTQTIQPFLFVSMRHAFINQTKHKQRHVTLEDIDFDIQYSVENNFLKEEEKNRIKQRVDEIMNRLTPRQREIIYLRFLHQMSYEEISRILEISEQAARNLIHRAISKIRKENTNDLILLIAVIQHISKIS